MAEIVPADEIEARVGVERHETAHFGRAVSVEQTVYILHSRECLDSGVDLRECRFTAALEQGITLPDWHTLLDRPVPLQVLDGRLVPIRVS